MTKKKSEKIPYFTKGFLINSGLAAGLVFMGAFVATEEITIKVVGAAFIGSGIVFLSRLKEWSDNCEKDKTSKLMNFTGI